MEKPVDRRKLRTRKALQNALVALILEKGYDAVSVSEVTDRADVGRATFYLHYKDKDELLIETLNATVRGFMDEISKYPVKIMDLENTDVIRKAFEFAEEHSDLFRFMMRGHGPFITTLRIQELIAEFIYEKTNERLGLQNLKPQIPMDVLANFFAGALITSIFWWLENDTGYSAEEMAHYYKKLVVLDRKKLIGV